MVMAKKAQAKHFAQTNNREVYCEMSEPTQQFRSYWSEPFDVAVLHGRPGAPGGVAPVARELSSLRGVL